MVRKKKLINKFFLAHCDNFELKHYNIQFKYDVHSLQ